MKLKTLAGSLLFVAPTASAAQSLINGQAVQYNDAYRCKGERVIIAHCRDEQDSSYCQVVYPDRPYVNGNQVAPVEMRGEVVAKLNACSQTASAPGQRNPGTPVQTNASKSVAPKAAQKGAAAIHAPGVEKASWWLLDVSRDQAVYFTKGGIKRSGSKGQGWFTIVYPEPQDISADFKGVRFLQDLFVADCVKGTFAARFGAYLGEDGDEIASAELDKPPRKPTPGTLGEEEYNLICGKPQKLFVNKAMDTDGMGLVFVYEGFLYQK